MSVLSRPAPPAAGSARHAAPASTRLSGLDGLRAVAVTAVVVYHLGAEWLPGGFLGVDLFFVISGFLITSLLLREVATRGRIDFGAFYLRRARRLLPALFLMLAGTALLVSVAAPDAVASFARDVPGALLYVSNWWAIGQDQSYFELIGRGNLLGHLWSLAVEEQFYLVWPLVVGLLCWWAARTGRRRRVVILAAALGGALASTAWMAGQAVSTGAPLEVDPTRLYFGTDTHAMSVLVGAALAAVWRPDTMRATLRLPADATITGVGVMGLIATGWLFVNVTEYSAWMYRGGFLVVALVFALVIAAATHPGAVLGRTLDVAPLRWVGERSYGIYLWHWPVFLLTRPGTDVPFEGPVWDMARVALTVGIAAASYRFVEVPVRRGAVGAWWRQVRQSGPVALAPQRRSTFAALAAAAVAAGIVTATFSAPPAAEELVAEARYGDIAPITDEGPPGEAVSGVPATTPAAVPDAAATPAAKPSAPSRPTEALSPADISWYGDSVTLWSAQVLRQRLPGVRLDAAINRSPGNIQDAVLRAHDRGRLGRVVVMHMGTAGPVSEDRLRSTLDQLRDRARVVLVTSTARFAWVVPGNATMKDVARDYDNVVVADWRVHSRGHAGWFEDGLHLTSTGKPAFADFVGDAALGRS